MLQPLSAALVAALTLVLVGCSDDDPKPAPQPTPSSPTSTPASPTSEPSSSPSDSPISALQTVKEWVAARNLAMSEGDLGPVRALSTPQCTSCADLIDPIEETHRAGGRYETKGWRVVRAKVTEDRAGEVQVTAGLELAGGRTFHSATADPVVYASEKRIGIFELTMSKDRWQVSLIGFVS